MQNPGPAKQVGLLLCAAAIALAAPSESRGATHIPVGPFHSVTMGGGGEVIVRHGPSQRVTLLAGRRECTRVTVREGELIIDGPHRLCEGERGMTIEVQTPAIGELMVANGGTLRTVGAFPSQEELIGTVENGGRLDIRSMKPGVLRAAVRQGGGIFAKPQASLFARIEQGGVISYWGNPKVKSSVEHGGVVQKGHAADANKPLGMFAPE